ncbi:phosphoglucosamine mutase [Leptospira wolffii]|uniref:Phosphoglucosamine mutase n=1 Tax=Leptospira wolffii TaxID=409998 RepID=A0A2M9ZFX7_9LEPT|nr:phosphoglucosamine mutase [Leptospira wolffii]PJZ67295.1 phosphoglucosamine mutase [Leptospira wolffii]TGK62287.1 phosphoglucosamine mutase [Leptospira wolffii]TGK68196.1 phosphoglucosamine mutase [Leptospira wolffii]TGK74329.1 phosphoglucosamine mutase [Leptospira wolffii]TGL32096.1 phosphoglucosamine mutase [Leptospira wolffii]
MALNPQKPVFQHPDLMVSVSGIRGIIPTGLSSDVIFHALRAFGSWLPGNTVVIGRDSRPSGEYIENIAIGIMLGMGKKVIRLGIVPTPTVKAVVNQSGAAGGIMISASHNPVIWNAFKFIGPGGFFTNAKDLEDLLDLVRKEDYKPFQFKPNSSVEDGRDRIQAHIDSVLARVNVAAIKKKKYTVFLDAVNGGGSFVLPELLKRLGCKVIPHNCKPDGTFPRPPEPTPEALKQSSRIIKQSKADIGFALDPDADRLVVLSPKKGAISEELTLPLSFLSYLGSGRIPKKASITVNLSTSFVNDWVADSVGIPTYRSKVGEANVVAEMIHRKSVFGGEGNGGVIDPAIPSFGRDSLSGVAHILNLLALRGEDAETVFGGLPAVHMRKIAYKIAGQKTDQIYSRFRSAFSDYKEDTRDGLRLAAENSWIHIRPSNTEPILRVIGEARSKKDLESLLEKAGRIMENS